MALMAVIARPEIRLAVTEAARLALCTRLGIDQARLPQRRYRRHRSAMPVTRFFPHAGLVGVLEAPNTKPGTVVFVYIDDGAASRSASTPITHHAQLFAALPVWRVIYVSETTRQATLAARVFAPGETSPGQSHEQAMVDLGECFHPARLYDGSRWEAPGLHPVSSASLICAPASARALSSLRRMADTWRRSALEASREAPGLAPASRRWSLPHSYAAVEGVRGLR
ncbi:MAG: hypothetical protein U0163_00310 [Gemmatimonadaceae bacterium]